ncbi:hypothetical protein [Aureimonas sp. ME7]|uniref:hypothetical protein n=1 Tax=Aureimonas sp. ME7 TaxID=2744252 RepID=UPI0015F7342A|nr:hypothetical protein [Aureimonas sp. ME7]
MASLIGSILGLVLGAALLGALIAWLLRRIAALSSVRSQAIGVAIATLLYALLSPGLPDPAGSLAARTLVAILGGLAAFGLVRATSRARA